VYLGWHYVLDDIAGLLIGAVALGLAYCFTGVPRRRRQADRPLGSSSRAPASA
jgi:membrane-associated phospholipid phosphatase